MKEENGTVEKEERDKREVRYEWDERDERGKGKNEIIEKELERKNERRKKKENKKKRAKGKKWDTKQKE